MYTKHSGPDELNDRVLKECSNEISPILALILMSHNLGVMYQMTGDRLMFPNGSL